MDFGKSKYNFEIFFEENALRNVEHLLFKI